MLCLDLVPQLTYFKDIQSLVLYLRVFLQKHYSLRLNVLEILVLLQELLNLFTGEVERIH